MTVKFKTSKSITKYLFDTDMQTDGWCRSVLSSIKFITFEGSPNLCVRSLLYVGSKNVGIPIDIGGVLA